MSKLLSVLPESTTIISVFMALIAGLFTMLSMHFFRKSATFRFTIIIESSIIIASIKVVVPHDDTVLQWGDVLTLVGSPNSLQEAGIWLQRGKE